MLDRMYNNFRNYRGRMDWAAEENWRKVSMINFFEHQVYLLQLTKGILEDLDHIHSLQFTPKELSMLFGGDEFRPTAKYKIKGLQHRSLDRLDSFVWTGEKEPFSHRTLENIENSKLDEVKLTGFADSKIIGTRINYLRNVYDSFLRHALTQQQLADKQRDPEGVEKTRSLLDMMEAKLQALRKAAKEMMGGEDDTAVCS